MYEQTGAGYTFLQKHQHITKERVRNFIHSGNWDSLGIRSAFWKKNVDGEGVIGIKVWSPPGLERPTFEKAMKQEFRPTTVGESFGPSWSTHWFKLEVTIPMDYDGEEVYLEFDPSCEGLVWSVKGEPVQGITGGGGDTRRVEYLLAKKAVGGQVHLLYVETSCNGLFGNGDQMIGPPNENRSFALSKASIGVKRKSAWDLYHDMVTLVDMAHHISSDNPRSINALYAANQVVNLFDHENPDESIKKGLFITRQFLEETPSSGTHQVSAIGNCHIDTAWLWMYDETKRKVARSFSSQIKLMETYPEYMFAASQAQQFEWLQSNYPSLFKEVQKFSKKGQFKVIGGTWVEMDCNLPSGESLSRQFILGQRYFFENFGVISKVFWLPDTFGYSAQLPQIVKQSGAKYFFTQKLSWNNINKFPHTSFNWVGLDGSSILTHMAPAETYTGTAQVHELLRSVKQHKDISSHNTSLYLYGHGDGGGGPQDVMIERIRRMSNTDGMPKIKHRDPTEFYEEIEKTSRSLPSWHGELYFELHRGTYTSQANNKKYNRLSEFLLRSAELLATMAICSKNVFSDYKYPHEEITRLWKLVCLNQFHDVIPGSSIEHVYRDSDKMYKDIIHSANKIRKEALESIVSIDAEVYNKESLENRKDNSSTKCENQIIEKSQDISAQTFSNDMLNFELLTSTDISREENNDVVVINDCSWPRSGVIKVPNLNPKNQLVGQMMASRKVGFNETETFSEKIPLILATNVPETSVSLTSKNKKVESTPVSVYQTGDGFYVLENMYISAKFDTKGRLVSIRDQRTEREFIDKKQFGNNFVLYDDVPLFWDAWDVEIYHLETPSKCENVTVEVLDEGPLLGSLFIQINVSKKSVLKQWVSLSATSKVLEFENMVDWNESHKFLKVEFGFDIKAQNVSYETQYGYVQRPTHRNNSWDMAKFEVCAHKFADLSEHGAGVALFNDSKYGYSCIGNKMAISLLRSPKSPDANCDMGVHSFRYGVYVHTTSFPDPQVVKSGYGFNSPLVGVSVNSGMLVGSELNVSDITKPMFSITGAPSVILDVVKMAEPELWNESELEMFGLGKRREGHADIGKFGVLRGSDNITKGRKGKTVVLRMYESCGGRAVVQLGSSYEIASVVRGNLLECEEYELTRNVLGSYEILVNPFEVVTLLVKI
ncbi:hypothetical protein BB559_004057 [Furculomyces boomerangus]|uniref:Alpha-mannosidase n=2 Tax=Harpellales TaxID=61421 RepID=A0A2T9YGX8_9FUNG|nr:hypothetical protein BB559_004057 [Furculomyces boomerangus]PWA00376.1 hypothetical protein BB558_003572 [Smittium angustum]